VDFQFMDHRFCFHAHSDWQVFAIFHIKPPL
jgi:hypothetical protein